MNRPGRRGVVDRILDLVVPPACVVCGRHLPVGEGGERRRTCPGCLSRLRPIPPPRCSRCRAPVADAAVEVAGAGGCRDCEDWPAVLEGAASATLLEGPASDLVHAFKYGGWPELAHEMVRPMAACLRGVGAGRAAGPFLSVPTTRERRRRRGYNQAEELARALSRVTGRPVVSPLVRTSGGASQVALHRSQRRANVRGAFRLREGVAPGHLPPRVVLVDDVLTTGATVVEVAETLEAAGVRGVFVLTFARARPGGRGRAPGGPADAPARLLDALRARGAGRRASGRPSPSPTHSSDERS